VFPDLEPISQVSAYLHVPFCTEKCSYCDFYSITEREPKIILKVIRETLDQLVHFLLQCGSPTIQTCFVGGGTPSSIGLEASLEFLTRLSGVVGSPDEWTVEVNPETVTEELLAIYAESGVNRLSMGVQSFSDRHFALLGRVGSAAANRRALELVADRWQGDLSLDLITGLPDQSEGEAMYDLAQILSHLPDHVSLYTLTVEPGTPLYTDIEFGRTPSPDEETGGRIWLKQIQALIEAGYEHYEVSNFCRSGKASRHNLAYWRMLPYVGCGPAGVSTLPGKNGPLRIENPRDVGVFSQGEARQWGATVDILTPTELFTEHLMMGLRLAEGISIDRLDEVFGMGAVSAIEDTLSTWRGRGLAVVTAGRVSLSTEGRLLLDAFMREAIAEIDTHTFPTIAWP
jgi:oxygen-independent coproporphyrinogen III oxidase